MNNENNNDILNTNTEQNITPTVTPSVETTPVIAQQPMNYTNNQIPIEDKNKSGKKLIIIIIIILLLLLLCIGILLLNPFKPIGNPNSASGSTSGGNANNNTYKEKITNMATHDLIYYNSNNYFVKEEATASFNDYSQAYKRTIDGDKLSYGSLLIGTRNNRSFEDYEKCTYENYKETTVCGDTLYHDYNSYLNPIFSSITVGDYSISTETVKINGKKYYHQKFYVVHNYNTGTSQRFSGELYIAQATDNTLYKVTYKAYNYKDNTAKLDLSKDMIDEYLDFKAEKYKK